MDLDSLHDNQMLARLRLKIIFGTRFLIDQVPRTSQLHFDARL